eukprot:TRINITY_DN12653_c0_g3_i2.p1 TRINITY_DN12653_c0_g3~~TRINITY_DN12653_c0_g3_i2.p1  ORF type:complete len:1803 (-),score=176.54 TRINITY_DN12653_c0_g3_i2:449-5857(-)
MKHRRRCVWKRHGQFVLPFTFSIVASFGPTPALSVSFLSRTVQGLQDPEDEVQAGVPSCKSIRHLQLNGQKVGEKKPAVVSSSEQMTSVSCYNKCMEAQSVYMGMQGGSTCACFDSFEILTAPADCDAPCSGSASEKCGGTAETSYTIAVMFAWVEKLPERSCGPPPAVLNAAETCSGGGPTEGRDCNVTCGKGYRLAVNSLLCDTARGEWIGSASCLDVTCHGAPSVLNAAQVCISASAAEDAGACEVQCIPGYELAENSLRCVAPEDPRAKHGAYSGQALCKPKSCGVPPARELTTSVRTEIFFPMSLTYTCSQGATLSGRKGGLTTYSTACRADGTFAPTTEQCQAVPCGAAPPLSHAALVAPGEDEPNPAEWKYPLAPKFACEKGFTLDGTGTGLTSFELPCQASGNFTEPPQCVPVRCGAAPTFQFTSTSGLDESADVVTYGKLVSYKCQEGYSLDAKDITRNMFQISCRETGLFDGMQTCVPISCGTAPVVENARSPIAEVFFPSRIEYSCMTGYTLNGSSNGLNSFSGECRKDGSFADTPSCLPVRCGTPPSFGHTKLRSASPSQQMEYPSSLTFECEDGFSTDRSTESGAASWVMQCLPTGHFSASKECLNIDDCVGHTCGPFGHCVDLLKNYTCKCQSGYEVRADEEGELMCGNVDDCGPQACGAGGTCKDLVNDYTCECDEGYELTVKDDEKLCTRVECGMAPEVEHAAAPAAKATFEDTVEYTCDAGYSVDGLANGDTSFSITCLASRAFSPAKQCKPVACGEPPAARFAEVVSVQLVFPKVARYQCAEGYTTDGNANGNTSFEISCTATGQLTALMECLPVMCGPAPTVEMALVVPHGAPLTYGQTANYTCTPGHALVATSPSDTRFSRSCLANGKFEEAAKCVPVTCALPLLTKTGSYTILPASTARFRSIEGNAEPCARVCGKTRLQSPEACERLVGEASCLGSYAWSAMPGDAVGVVMPCEWTGQSCRRTTNGGNFVYGCKNATAYCSSREQPSSQGDGFCATGLRSGQACCPKSCGSCGGQACAGFPGGASKCCSNTIVKSGPRCANPADTACAIPIPAKASEPNAVVTYQTNIAYQCPQGRTTSGEIQGPNAFTASCNADGHLEGLSTCQKVRAIVNIPVVQHTTAKTEATVLYFGDRVVYNVDPGYAVSPVLGETGLLVVDGTPKTSFDLKVLMNGRFEIPPTIRNIDDCVGHSCGPHGTCKDEVQNYTCVCEEGFELNILENGEKICGNVDDCGPDACGEHGVCIDLVSDYTCECQGGYELSNITKDDTIHKVCSAKRCPSVAMVPNSNLNQNTTLRFPEDVKVICDEGYSTDGTTADDSAFFSVQCQEDGTLSSRFECRPVECGVRPLVPLATLVSSQAAAADKVYAFNDEVSYVCPEGHSLDGEANGDTRQDLRCGSDGQFPATRSCKPIKCGAPPNVAKAASSAVMVHFPATVTYTCDAGYSLNKAQASQNTFAYKCTASGSFERGVDAEQSDVEAPRCVEVSCGEPPSYQFANHERGERRFGQTVAYTCEDGHSSDGTLRGLKAWSITCGSTGTYSPARATACQAITFKVVGRVLDATNLASVRDAVVTISKGDLAVQASTNHRGEFRVEGVPAGDVEVKAEVERYITGTKRLMVERSVLSGEAADLTISPVLPPDGWRIVLRWNERPRDLDSHIYFGERQSCHGYYSRKRVTCSNGVRATLDVDDTNGVGPETVTLSKVSGSCHRQRGECKIVFKVHNYSRRPGFQQSDAVVKLYNGDREMGEFRVKAGDGTVHGDWWSVVSIDGKAGTFAACTTSSC